MADTSIKNDAVREALADEQLSDILLVMDKEQKTIQAVKNIDKNGKVKTTAATRENQNEFLKIGNNSDPLDVVITTVKNFYSQARDPTRFDIFRIPFKTFNESLKYFRELLKENYSKAAGAYAEKHRIEIPHSAKQNNNTNNKNKEEMEQDVKTPDTAQQAPDTTTDNKQRFNESMINWPEIEKAGISREYLKDKGLLDGMLKGYKTSQTVPISMNFGSFVIRTDARLSFQQTVDGQVALAAHGIRKEPQLDRPFFGHIFSDEDKKNLRETGNMGRMVELKNRNGDYVPTLISIDKITNEIVATRADTVFIPEKVKGVELTDQEKNDLREGKKIFVDGMTANSGKEFSAYLQINADRRGIEYIFENDGQKQGKMIFGGIELSPQQQKDYEEGKAIFLEDMKRKDGELFSSFIKKDEATNKPAYTRYNPDSPEGNREIYIPKEFGGVQITGDEREALRRGEHIFLDGMINRKGEEFSSYIKINLETGTPQYAKKPDDFTNRQQFKVPAEIWGVTLNVQQRAQLQDGRAVLIEGMKGFDGKEFSSFVKVNPNQGKLDYYKEDPDKRKNTQSRNAASDNTTQRQSATKNEGATAKSQSVANENKQAKKAPKKSTGRKM